MFVIFWRCLSKTKKMGRNQSIKMSLLSSFGTYWSEKKIQKFATWNLNSAPAERNDSKKNSRTKIKSPEQCSEKSTLIFQPNPFNSFREQGRKVTIINFAPFSAE